jgi:predicted nucleic-acid-binding Zn-ribbon protein
MSQEKPQLEARRSQLLQSLANDNQMLRELEDRTLEMLQRSEMNILDDQDLIDTLQRSQDMAVEIRHRVIMTKDTEQKLNAARKRYLPVSCRQRSYLYFYSKTLVIIMNVDLRTVNFVGVYPWRGALFRVGRFVSGRRYVSVLAGLVSESVPVMHRQRR